MLIKKLFISILLCCCSTYLYAATADKKYCDLLQQLHPGMKITDVFMLLGPPHTFGQPPNLDVAAMYNKSTNVMPPQETLGHASSEKELMKNVISTDPILQAFVNAGPNTINVLIWQYENNTLTISVKTKGPKVLDVNANFSC